MHKLINAVLFQAIWFSAILVGWELALVPLSVMLIHGLAFEPGQHHYRFVLAFVAIGFVWDSMLVYSGVFAFAAPEPLSLGVMPLWLLGLWAGFALTLNSSLSWWKDYPVVFVIACAVAGPLSYFAGTRLGALTIEPFGFALLSVAWGLLAVLVVKARAGMRVAEPARREGKVIHQVCGLE